MKVKEFFPSKYLAADDLGAGDHSFTIASYKAEEINSEEKLVLYFKGTKKGLVTNKTNAEAIAEVLGDEVETWAGKTITLFRDRTRFQGKPVPCIRVRVPAATPDEDPLF